jgi:hypothetical protein
MCGIKNKDIESLQHTLKLMEQQAHELRIYIDYKTDLNIITPYITKYYTEVYRTVSKDFRSKNVQFHHNSWIELFSAASIEMAQYDAFEIESKPLTDIIILSMKNMGGLSELHWETLQEVRRDRNNTGHPHMEDDRVLHFIQERWTDHNAYDALNRMMKYIRNRRIRSQNKISSYINKQE